MNGPPPPPGIPAQRLGPLALNLRDQMLRKNTNARLAALNSIGVSPPEPTKNLPRLSNLATFPVTESVLAPPSKLSAKASNWAPSPSPLPLVPPPGLPPLPYMASYVPNYTVPVSQPLLPLVPPPGLPPLPYMASYMPSYTAPELPQPQMPYMSSYVANPYTMPSHTAHPSLSPKMLIEYMLDGGRVYINNYPAHIQTELNEIMRQYKSQYSISQHYRDGNSPSTNPYYFIRKTANRPPSRSKGQTKSQRRRNKRNQTRRHH